MNIALIGNNGELRSEPKPGEKPRSSGRLFGGLFGGSASSIAYLPETRALDRALEEKQARKPFKVKPEFEPQLVEFRGYEPGTIVIDTTARRLYLVESSSTARRYAIAVGRDGLQYKGTVAVGDKQEWPRWIPTLDMQKRDPKQYGQYKDGMPGGGAQPARRARHLPLRWQEGHASAHPRHHRAADDRHQLVERLLPHDQRPRHGPLPARADGYQSRHHLTARLLLPKGPVPTPALSFCLRAARRILGKFSAAVFSLAESVLPR